tara:strand:+ start:1012 stop:1200 length:189 start_codon:yes stop_codon:yes gene_type:complete
VTDSGKIKQTPLDPKKNSVSAFAHLECVWWKEESNKNQGQDQKRQAKKDRLLEFLRQMVFFL